MRSQNISIKRIFILILYPLSHRISIIKTLYFNFYYFPIKVALRFPVILHYGVKLKKMKGTVELDCDRIKPGMVRLGRTYYGFHTRHHHTIWEQKGGKVIFGSNICLGRGTFISVGYRGNLTFGDSVVFGGNSKIICWKSIRIGARTLVSWNAQIIDTDFHSTLNTIFKTRNRTESSIVIGSHNWIGFGCTLLKGSVTPNHCIVGANTSLKSDYSKSGENIVLAFEQHAKVIVQNITFDEQAESSKEEMPEVKPAFMIVDQQSRLKHKSG